MLITEHTIPNTRNLPSSRTAQQPKLKRIAQQRTVQPQTVQPTLEWRVVFANALKLMSKAGDRQSWLLLALVMLPVIGMIRNFMTYGFER